MPKAENSSLKSRTYSSNHRKLIDLSAQCKCRELRNVNLLVLNFPFGVFDTLKGNFLYSQLGAVYVLKNVCFRDQSQSFCMVMWYMPVIESSQILINFLIKMFVLSIVEGDIYIFCKHLYTPRITWYRCTLRSYCTRFCDAWNKICILFRRRSGFFCSVNRRWKSRF